MKDAIAWTVIVLALCFGGAVFLGNPHERFGYLKAAAGIAALLALLAVVTASVAGFIWAVGTVAS